MNIQHRPWFLAIAALLVAAVAGGCVIGPQLGPSDLTLTVKDRDGAALAGAQVSLVDGGRIYGPETANASGMVQFKGVRPGTYTVTVVPASGPEFSSEIVVRSNETQRVEVRGRFFFDLRLIIGRQPNPDLNIRFSDNWPEPRYGEDHIGWFDPGRSFTLDFTVPAGEAGTYSLMVYGAGMFPSNGHEYFLDGVSLGELRMDPETGDWENWRWYTLKSGIQLSEGTHELKVVSRVGGRNFHTIRWVRTDG